MKVHAFFIGVFAPLPKANQKCGHSPLRAQATCAVAARSTIVCLRSRGNGRFACPSSSTAHSFIALMFSSGTVGAKNRFSCQGQRLSVAQIIAGARMAGIAARCRSALQSCEKSSPVCVGTVKPRQSRLAAPDCINPLWRAGPSSVIAVGRRVAHHPTDRRERRHDNPELSDKPIKTECQITRQKGS